MHGDEDSRFGENEAQRILEAGWRQGSVFRPPVDFALPVPFDHENEWLVVCTQSCTVVSRDLAGDPHIEFLVAKPTCTTRRTRRKRQGRPCAASICQSPGWRMRRRWNAT